MSQPSTPNIREPIPGYVLKERIGVGGYGEVWSAQAPGDLAKAVKLVYGHFDDARASRELKALKRIKEVRHPFLLSLERIEIIDGQLIIVTELADRSLKDRFDEAQAAGNCVARDELLGYLRDAADALDYMSDNFSLQHLDVKPENLLLVGNRVKVADFGLVKELQDVTASIMGGLTPVYASPEVFDGRPSQRSDQYSLAIVYQELLTGVLPFPGKTAAQLASQHVHARPRITSLPKDDQPIIARALAKEPSQRFANCRALIDSLSGEHRTPRGPDQPTESLPADSTSDTTSVRSRLAETDPTWRPASDHGSAAPTPNVKTMVIGESAEAPHEEKHASRAAPEAISDRPLIPAAAPNPTPTGLPPVEIAAGEATLRPTLFLAVGGAATRTLRQLRRQLHDRWGGSTSLPAVQMLAIDTDPRSLYDATQGDCETALAERETLTLHLRTSRDYTALAPKKLRSLSRRWLYNIPRSLQTEGRRPLGRLALVDHSEQVLARLRSAVSTITGPAALAETTAATGAQFASNVPRVFVIASTSGGTGGGMVLDLAYAVRTILAELSIDDDGVCGMLVHATDRNPTAADLAVANSYATINELFHYSGADGYPGDEACGLPPFDADAGVFPHAYFVHLGDNLNDQEFERGTEALASYLYLNAFTTAAPALDACRRQPAAADRGSLRTFGLSRIGSLCTALPTLATEQLCKEVIERWRGGPKAPPKTSSRTSLVDMATQRSDPATAMVRTDVAAANQLAAAHAEQCEVDFPRLTQRVLQLIEGELGGNPAAVLAHMCASLPAGNERDEQQYVQHVLSAMAKVFGPSDPAEASCNAVPAPIQLALADDLKQLASPLGETIREWILGLVNTSAGRVALAASTKQWYDKHLRTIETETHERLREQQRDLLAVEQTVRATVATPRKRSLFGRQDKKVHDELTKALTYLIAGRCEQAAGQALIRVCRLIAAPVSAAGERIADLQRELGQLAQTFSDDAPWSDRAGESQTADDVTAAIVEAVRARMPELIEAVDQRVHATFVEQEGGLRNVLERADNLRTPLVRALRAEARAQILLTLKDTAIDAALIGDDADAALTRLQPLLNSALPKLDRCGGQQRLVAAVPQASSDTSLVTALTQQLEPAATVVVDTDPDLMLCYETQALWAPYVGARLIGDRGDLVPIAARLHTRSDVAWTDLASATQPEPAACQVD
jgi:serine/threonine protein kinase